MSDDELNLDKYLAKYGTTEAEFPNLPEEERTRIYYRAHLDAQRAVDKYFNKYGRTE